VQTRRIEPVAGQAECADRDAWAEERRATDGTGGRVTAEEDGEKRDPRGEHYDPAWVHGSNVKNPEAWCQLNCVPGPAIR